MGISGFFRGLFRLPRSFAQSIRILRRFDPDVVVGVGGYSSGPLVLAAWMMRIPTAVQEQNALPGFTNRVLGILVDAVFIAFPEAQAGFPVRKTHLLGNPIRRAFLDNYLHTKVPTDRLSIFVTGGSQGAHVLNQRVAEAMEILAPQIGSRLSLLHQTGVKDQGEIAARYQKLKASGLSAEAGAFIDDMPRAHAGADLLVCPAGAPPGAALLLPERELTAQKLADELRALEADRGRLQKMSRASGLLGRPEAAREIADVCVSLCSERLVREGRHLPEARK